jgi:hypothetical protein
MQNTTTDRAAQPAGDLYIPTDISPEQFFRALGRLRKEAMDEIDRLLTFLDALGDCDEDSAIDDDPCDGDPDAEPALGWTDMESRWGKPVVRPDGEDEPVLGSVVATDQTTWASGNQDDREGDGCADDREGDEEQHGGEALRENDEPSLGWTDEEVAGGRAYAGAMGDMADLEAGPGARPPQYRTAIERAPIAVENTYRRFLHGLRDCDKSRLLPRMTRAAGVLLR